MSALLKPDSEAYADIPDAMKMARRWLVWNLEEPEPGKEKPRKKPFYASGKPRSKGVSLDSPEDMAQFASFDEAIRALNTGRYTGLGFALGPDGTGNYWQGIDLDHISQHPHLAHLADDLPGYTETSPSGDGMHAIGYGRPFTSMKDDVLGIEAYAGGRYFTVTGEGAGIHEPVCIADFVETRLRPLTQRKSNQQQVPRIAPCEVLQPQQIQELRSALYSMRADDYKLWTEMGMRLKTLGDTGRGLWMAWSETSKKFDPAEAAEKWETFQPRPAGEKFSTSWRAVFSTAQAWGWVNPMKHYPDIDSEPVAGERLELNTMLVPLSNAESETEPPHVVERILPIGEVTVLGGHGGMGKSYVAEVLGVHVALGRAFGPLKTQQANVLLFSAEDGGDVLRYRLGRICEAMNISPDDLQGRMHLLDASDTDAALHRGGMRGRDFGNCETELLQGLAELVKALEIGLVIVDNASDVFDDDEIQRARVRRFIRSLRAKLARPGRAVLLLAHVNKSAANSRSAQSEDYSGSTAWHNSARSRLALVEGEAGRFTLEHRKANLGPKSVPIGMEWRDGVPVVSGTAASAGSEAAASIMREGERKRDMADKDKLVALIVSFDARGERVTTSFQGSATVYKLLRGEPGFPAGTGSERLMRLLRELEAEGRIFRREVRTPDRKWREVFTCAPIPPESVQGTGGDAEVPGGEPCAK